MTFDTVEDFWACYHHVQLPSRLPMGSDYMLFKDGIQPKWEDEQNRDGGKWAIETDKKYRPHLDGTWLETLLAVIGEGNFILQLLGYRQVIDGTSIDLSQTIGMMFCLHLKMLEKLFNMHDFSPRHFRSLLDFRKLFLTFSDVKTVFDLRILAPFTGKLVLQLIIEIP